MEDVKPTITPAATPAASPAATPTRSDSPSTQPTVHESPAATRPGANGQKTMTFQAINEPNEGAHLPFAFHYSQPADPAPSNSDVRRPTETMQLSEPPPKRRRMRAVMAPTICRLCGRTFRYQRPHFVKYHPEKISATGHVIGESGEPEPTWQGSQEESEADEWEEPTPRPVAKMTFGGAPAGRFCAKCGLIVQHWAEHQREAHGIEYAANGEIQDISREQAGLDAETEQVESVGPHRAFAHKPEQQISPSVQRQNSPTSQPQVSATLGQRRRSPMIHRYTPPQSSQRHRPAANPRQTPPPSAMGTPNNRSIPRPRGSGDDEEPYEKLLRIIKSEAELTSDQRNALIFDLLKQQITLLPRSATPTSIGRPSTAQDSPDTPQFASSATYMERDEAARTSLVARSVPEKVIVAEYSKNGAEQERHRSIADRDADDDDLFS
jgi:hypothetical protein